MFIEFDRVSKRFERAARRDEPPVVAVHNVSLGVRRGEMLALVGASGSGKTTLLRCLAGLETPDGGRIRIGDRDVFSASQAIDVPVERRDVGLIFQTYALWPHLTVERNVAYPLERRKLPAAQIRSRVADHLDRVECAALAHRYPHELSGGQQQRIALARALVYEPAVVLFDEPLSNLDPSLREHLRAQIRDLQRRVGFTGVYVTHDQAEAFYVGDHIALLSQGELLQTGTPDEIFKSPANPLAARFAGATNAAEGDLVDAGAAFASADLGKIPLGAPFRARGGPCQLLCRPEAIRLVTPKAGSPRAKIVDRVRVGDAIEYALELPGGNRWRARQRDHDLRFDVGSEVAIELAGDGMFLFERPQR